MRFFNKWKNEKGQATVEFAIILPILLLILCAVIDFGWLFTNELVLSSAVRDGARYGITCAEDSDYKTKIEARVKQEATICKDSAMHVEIEKVNGNADIKVDATYDLEMLTPVWGMLFGGSTRTIDSECIMKIE